MMHLLVSQSDQSLQFGFETPIDGPLEMTVQGDSFSGAASVLNGLAVNAQFGWLASGFFSLPAGSGVFVRAIHQDAGLVAYDGFTFDPIFGTDGSSDVWQWSGAMTHNWYGVSSPGLYEATYEVYVGDSSGASLDGWTGALVELSWVFGSAGLPSRVDDLKASLGVRGPAVIGRAVGTGPIPTPSAVGLMVVAGVLSARRRARAV